MTRPRFLTPLAKRIQRIARIDLRYTVTGGFFLTAGQIASALIGLILTVAFANLLPVETYGTFRYLLAAYSILAIAALPGIDTAILQSVSRGKEGSWAAGARAKFRWSLLGTAGSLLFAGYQFALGHDVIGMLFVIAGIALPFMESYSLYVSFLNGRKLFASWTIIDVLTQTVSALVLIGTMVLTKNIVLLMIGYFAPYIITRFLATWYVKRTYTPNAEQDPELFAYGRSMTVFQIVGRIAASADQILLYHFLGPAQVAIFALATAVPNRVQSVFRSAGALAFPKFAQRSQQQIAESLPRKMALFTIVILLVCGAYVLLAPPMFTYVFPKYLASLTFSQVAIFYTLSSITYPFGAYLAAHKKVRDNYVVAIGSFIPKLLCLVILVPLIGIWGAIIGLLATSIATIGITLYMLVRDRKEPIPSQ